MKNTVQDVHLWLKLKKQFLKVVKTNKALNCLIFHYNKNNSINNLKLIVKQKFLGLSLKQSKEMYFKSYINIHHKI